MSLSWKMCLKVYSIIILLDDNDKCFCFCGTVNRECWSIEETGVPQLGSE